MSVQAEQFVDWTTLRKSGTHKKETDEDRKDALNVPCTCGEIQKINPGCCHYPQYDEHDTENDAGERICCAEITFSHNPAELGSDI